jgi:GMP synthase-like glutamine amidotransferase
LNHKKILILDYSVDREETAVVKQWLPENAHISSIFIDTKSSFPNDLINENFTHVIHTGSALSINEDQPFTPKAVSYIQEITDQGVSQMGICYGHQLVCQALVGKHAVRSSPNGLEAGWNSVTFVNNAMNILAVREHEFVWQHHFDEVTELPKGSELLASNPHSGIQAYINYEQRLFGTQFHPEFDKETGNKIFLEDRELLEKNGYAVDAMIKHGPSIDTGKLFFGFLLEEPRLNPFLAIISST